MKISLKNSLSLVTLFLFFLFAIASAPKHMVYSDYDKWIPGDFNPNTMTLLIEDHPLGKKQNNRMIKFLDDKYPYSYEIVDLNTIMSATGQYANTKKYPFVLRWKPQNSSYTTSEYLQGNRLSTTTHSAWDMYGYFFDRVNNKKYPATRSSNVWGQIGYRPVFNSIKKKFTDKEK